MSLPPAVDSDNAPDPRLSLNGTYGNDAPIYRSIGITNTIPFPPLRKSPPPDDYTGNKNGNGHKQVTAKQHARWCESRPDAGVGFVLDDGQQAVDSDNYAKGDRPAGAAMAGLVEIEERTGCEYPMTAALYHRDDGSAKYFYRCTPGVKWRGSLCSGVEILSHNYRYVHAGINPHTCKQQQWGWGSPTTGIVATADGPIPPDQWAALPDPLEAEHAAEDNGLIGSLATDEQARRWLENMPQGPMSPKVRDVLARALSDLSGRSGSRHDRTRQNVRQLVEYGAAGLTGAETALATIESELAELRKTDPDRTSDVGEFRRIVEWSAKRCRPDVFHALQCLDRSGGRIPIASLGSGELPDEPPPSWAPVDMRTARLNRTDTLPTIGRRVDGECLFYDGKVHSLHGETESGKSWVAQFSAAQCLMSDDTTAVLYVDFEDNAADVGERLIRLGVPPGVVDDPARFVYVHPSFPLSVQAEREAFDELLSRRFDLAVIDGVTESMAMAGLSTDRNTEVAEWQLQQPRAIASRTGAAVVCIDHVTKDADTRGRHAIGSQHKLAGLDGAAFVVEVEQPFGQGKVGVATLRIAKDRPGHLRGRLGIDYRQKDQTHLVAKFRHDATDPEQITATLDVPTAAQSDQTPTGKAKQSRRPTWEMEQVSRYWAETADARERTHRKTVDAMARRCAGKSRNPTRQAWRDAIGLLVDEGYATYEDGPQNSQRFRNTKRYNEADDPASDRFKRAVHIDAGPATANDESADE